VFLAGAAEALTGEVEAFAGAAEPLDATEVSAVAEAPDRIATARPSNTGTALTVFFSGGAEAFEGAAEPLAVAEL
jgi:hypothetical protein